MHELKMREYCYDNYEDEVMLLLLLLSCLKVELTC